MSSTRLSSKETQAIRLALIERKQQLSDRLNRLTEESAQGNPRDQGEISSLPTHLADLGTETFDQETTIGLAERTAAEVRDVEGALERIEEGTYGVCVKCGQRISPARLQALPSASLCTSCQASLESA